MSKTKINCNPFGCVPLLLSILAIVATCCGVTVNGKHYDLSCSCSRGVDITTTSRP